MCQLKDFTHYLLLKVLLLSLILIEFIFFIFSGIRSI